MKTEIHIHIGDYHASRQPVVIRTILGSCVTVCLFDAKRRIGGMNHILLPGAWDMNRFNTPARYGINAMELLINRIMALGGDRGRLIAKVFGGANMMPTIYREKGIGERNVEFAMTFLKRERIPVRGQDVGGTTARRLYFHTDTGDVYIKRIPPRLHTWLAREQAKARKRIENALTETRDPIFF